MAYEIVKINPEVYRGYDIRGVVGKDFSDNSFYTLGKGYATFLHRRQIRECVVGMDIRETSPEFKKAFVEGLLEMGINVVDFGLSLTQIMYFAQYHYLSKGGAIITASHNPREYNGLKLGVGFSDTMISEEIQELRRIVEEGKFEGWEKRGEFREEDVFPYYKSDLFKRVPLHDCGLKVVIDSSCATTGKFLPEILREAGCEVIEQNTNLDGSFPLGTPDPTEREVVIRLAEGVKKAKADLGVTYDSDGDRLGIVDEDGRIIWNDVLVAIFAQDVINFLPGSPIVYNTLCSKATSDVISEAGGEGVMWKTGHSFIKAKVKEVRAPFGGELSGHFFFMDNFFGHDDGAFATLRLLSYLKRTGLSLKQAVDRMPKYISSPEIKLGLADNIKFKMIDEQLASDIKVMMPDAKYVTIDGFRADSKEEMAIVRASQNGPYITIKFEGKTQEQYDRLKVELSKILHKYPEIDWSVGVNIHAFE
jgi:phosphomannomutase / phosphoglucomutase